MQLKRRREAFTLHPQAHNPPAKPVSPMGRNPCVPHQQGHPKSTARYLQCQLPLPRFPRPAWCQAVGKEEPKPCCRQQNVPEGQGQASRRYSRLCHRPQRVLAESKGIPAVGNAAVAAMKHKIQAAEAVGRKQTPPPYRLRSRGKSEAGELIWEPQGA